MLVTMSEIHLEYMSPEALRSLLYSRPSLILVNLNFITQGVFFKIEMLDK